jgi:hypothetical protein
MKREKKDFLTYGILNNSRVDIDSIQVKEIIITVDDTK